MDLEDGDYILKVAVAELKGQCNVLLTAVRKKDKWVLEARTRIIVDGKIFDSMDRKKSMQHEFPLETPEEQVGAAVDMLYNDTMEVFSRATGDVKSEVIEIRGGLKEFYDKVSRSDFFHMKKLDKDGKEIE